MYTHVYVCFAYIVKKDREKDREREKEICIAYIIQREKKTVRERYININIHVYIYIYIYIYALHIMSTETCMYRYKDLDPEKQCDQHIQTTCDSWICDEIHASVE